jgi:hypothetical protein
MLWIMLTAVIVATVGAHLGLWSAIVQVAQRVAKCEKCASMWLSLSALLYADCPLIAAVVLSIFGAYLSFYVGLILVLLNKLYNRLWQRINKLK